MLSLCLTMLQDPEDEPLFEEFYNKYNKLVYYVARENLSTHELAEDCVQEVFLNFAKNFRNIKGSLNDIRIESFIRIVTKNMSVDVYRKNRRHTEKIADADISEFYNISDEEFDFCENITLKQAIDRLPEEIKTVLYLKYVCDYSGTEIAQMLGITETLVRKRCMQGRQLAKKFIEGDKNG